MEESTSTPPRGAPRPAAIAMLVALLSVPIALLVGPGLVDGEERVPGWIDSDSLLLFYGRRTAFVRSLARGEIPFWNPHELLGFPEFAAGQTACFYPPFYLLYPWLATGRALLADVALHLLVLGLGMAALARAAGLGPAAANLAALLVTTSPLVILRFHGGHVTVLATLAWLPGITACFTRIARGERVALLPGALLLGLALHAGHIQELYYLLAFGLPAALGAALLRRDPRALGALLLALVLGLGLGSLQWLALAELAGHSTRQRTAGEWILEKSIRPVDLLAVLGPDVFGERLQVPYWGRTKVWETAAAPGLVLTLLAAGSLLLSPTRRTLALAATVLAVVLLTLGLDLPFQGLARRIVPGFDSFRAHARLLLLSLLPMGILAATTIEALAVPGGRRRLAASLVLVGLAGALVGTGLVLARLEPSTLCALLSRLHHPAEAHDRVDVWALVEPIAARAHIVLVRASLLALGLALLVLVSARLRLGCLAATLAGALALLEFLDAALLFAITTPAPRLPAEALRFLADRPAATRVSLGVPFVPTLPSLHGLESPVGSVSLMLAWTQDLLWASQGLDPAVAHGGTFKPMRLDGPARLFGVSRAVADPDDPPPRGLESVTSPRGLRLFEARTPWPRAWIVHRLRPLPDDRSSLAALVAPSFDAAREAIVTSPIPEGIPPLEEPPAGTPPPTARIVARTANTLTLEARLALRGLLVLAETYDPGWTARATTGPCGPESHGPPRDLVVLRVDHALRGVVLEPGHTCVTFTYRPRTLPWGIALTLLALTGIGVMATRSPRPPGSPGHIGRLRGSHRRHFTDLAFLA